MSEKGPVASGPVQRLVTSIIKETDLDPCGEHSSEDLGASGLYDLSKVCLVIYVVIQKILLIFTVMLYFRC